MFVGYSEIQKAYRLLNPLSRKITISRNVTFTSTHMLFNFPANSQNELHKITVEVTFPNVDRLPASRPPITQPPITPPTTVVQPCDQSTLPDGIAFPPL